MATRSSNHHTRTARAVLDSYLASGDPDESALYLTNEVFLYRVVRSIASDTGEMVELEDCYSLDTVHVPIHTLHTGRLRVVIAAPNGGSAQNI
ncbi:MAG TPA: hypothetical protein VME22_13010 [Solirubrobacteraceae bacterium]|nr:hypothetical protein [Solirubrobacteraceae bacterium]